MASVLNYWQEWKPPRLRNCNLKQKLPDSRGLLHFSCSKVWHLCTSIRFKFSVAPSYLPTTRLSKVQNTKKEIIEIISSADRRNETTVTQLNISSSSFHLEASVDTSILLVQLKPPCDFRSKHLKYTHGLLEVYMWNKTKIWQHV